MSLEKKLLMMLFAITCGNLFCSFRVYHFLSLHNHYSVIAGSLYNPLNINNFLEEGTWNNVLLSDLLLHLKSPKGIGGHCLQSTCGQEKSSSDLFPKDLKASQP